jgi:hypothetical protein
MPMEIKEDTFEEYFKTIKDDFYHNLALNGCAKQDMSPATIQVSDMLLLHTAQSFWEIKLKIDKIPEMFEASIPYLTGGGYQPIKSDLDDSNPPQDTGASK